jgi:hypothetical protein
MLVLVAIGRRLSIMSLGPLTPGLRTKGSTCAGGDVAVIDHLWSG